MHKARFWQKKDEQIQCQLCNHYCLIGLNKTGLCGVRQNIDQTLYTLVYGKVITENIDPIEKKPLFHFLPGSTTYSLATVGCNLSCKNCQNADISQYPIEQQSIDMPGLEMTAEEVVNSALQAKCQSISYTYTEPTIFAEFALDCMKLASQNGLKNVWVSNGYTSPEVLNVIIPYLNAINIDLKFFDNDTYLKICGAKLNPILENLKLLNHNKIWLEVTTLIIPGINDSDQELIDLTKFIRSYLGKETPWHVSRFFPQYKLKDQHLTEEELIYKAIKIGQQAGLKYVYGGNMDTEFENTYCPNCQQEIIHRQGYNIKRFDQQGHCPQCNLKLEFVLT